MRARSGKTVLRKRARTRKLTKGFRLGRHHLFKQAMITLIRGRKYASRDRRDRKRLFRRLWIIRISAASCTPEHGRQAHRRKKSPHQSHLLGRR